MIETSKTKLSVLMPAHNSAKTIKLAVISCLLAMPRNSELLIFLDNCTDNTQEVLSRIKDKRIKVFQSDENIGHGFATNFLASVATGEYVARFDADDICFPGRFAIQLAWLKRTGADVVAAGAIKFGVKPLKLVFSYPLSLNSNEFNHSLVLMNSSFHSAMIVRRSSLNETLLYEKRNGAEDYMFLLKAAISDLKIVSIPLHVILYRLHPHQISAQEGYQDKINQDGYLVQLRNQLSRKLAYKNDAQDKTSEALNLNDFVNSERFEGFVKDSPFFTRIWFNAKLKTLGFTPKAVKFSNTNLAGALDLTIFRGLAAALTFILAYLFNPTVVGYYATPLLFLSLYQALVEGPVRTLAPQFGDSKKSESYVFNHSVRWKYVSVFTLFVLTFTTLYFSGSINLTSALIAAPLCLSPLIAGNSVLKQMVLQKSKEWSLLLKARVLSTIFAFIALMILFATTHKAEVVGLFLPLIDILLILGLRRVKMPARERMDGRKPQNISTEAIERLTKVVQLRLTSWMANQTDRLFVAIISGPLGIGIFSVSYAVSRAIPESIYLGGGYRLSAQMGTVHAAETVKLVLSRYVRMFCYISLCFQIFVEVVLSFLSEQISLQWEAVLSLVPLLLLSLIPQLLSATMSIVISQRANVTQLLRLQIFCIFLSVAVAFVFHIDMIAGCVLLLVRELIAALASLRIAKEYVSRKLVKQATAGILAATLIHLAFRLI